MLYNCKPFGAPADPASVIPLRAVYQAWEENGYKTMRITMEMEMWMEMAMEMEMWMEMVMVIFGARKARSELRFASKWLLISDFDVLEASGAPKGDQERPKKFPKAPKKLPRSPQEAPKGFLGGALGVLGSPKSFPSHDPRYIHRFPSLQEPSRRSPRHDRSALSTF